jgi:hypothetical protein
VGRPVASCTISPVVQMMKPLETHKDDDNESLATHAWSGCLSGSQDDCFTAGGKQSQSTRSGTAGLAMLVGRQHRAAAPQMGMVLAHG